MESNIESKVELIYKFQATSIAYKKWTARGLELCSSADSLVEFIKSQGSLNQATLKEINNFKDAQTTNITKSCIAKVNSLLDYNSKNTLNIETKLVELQIRQVQMELLNFIIGKLKVKGYIFDKLHPVVKQIEITKDSTVIEVHLAGINSRNGMRLLIGKPDSKISKHKTMFYPLETKHNPPIIGDYKEVPSVNGLFLLNSDITDLQGVIRLVDENGFIYVSL